MVILCEELDKRLNDLWYKLQQYKLKQMGGHVSQVQLDEECVDTLERLVMCSLPYQDR
jgi:hypothetical protein